MDMFCVVSRVVPPSATALQSADVTINSEASQLFREKKKRAASGRNTGFRC